VLVPKYLEAREGEVRPNSFREFQRYLTKTWAPLHARPIAEIKRADVVARVGELAEGSGKVTADRARRRSPASLLGGAHPSAGRDTGGRANKTDAQHCPYTDQSDRGLTVDARYWHLRRRFRLGRSG
jgi:hypothetical protein